MQAMRALLSAAAVLVLVSSCGDDDASPATTAATTVPATSVSTTTTGAVTTVSPSTLPPSTTAAPTSAPVTTSPPTTVACPPEGSTDDVEEDFPGGLSGLAGVELDAGRHDCFDRLVLRLAPAPDNPTPLEFPGHWVRYTDEPVHLGMSDETVEIRGEAVLLVTVASWMYDTDADGAPTDYRGLGEVPVPGLRHVVEIRLVDNFEGMHTWAIGLDARRPFEVDVLRSPDRLVVDVFDG